MMSKYILMVLLTFQFLSADKYADLASLSIEKKVMMAPKPLPRVASLTKKHMICMSQLKIRAMDYDTHEEYIIIIDMDSCAKIKIEKNPALGNLEFEIMDSCNSDIELLES